jgi:phage gp46-like protein
MTDLAIAWDSANFRGDWVIANGGLATGSDLESAVLVSLFTDRIASPDFVPTDGTNDRRGWWADTYESAPIGSRLWQLARAKKTDQTTLLNQARDYCREALQWLLDDGVAGAVDVVTYWLSATTMGIQIRITRPQGTTFQYSWSWNSL